MATRPLWASHSSESTKQGVMVLAGVIGEIRLPLNNGGKEEVKPSGNRQLSPSRTTWPGPFKNEDLGHSSRRLSLVYGDAYGCQVDKGWTCDYHYPTGFPGSSVCRQKIMGLLSLCNHVALARREIPKGDVADRSDENRCRCHTVLQLVLAGSWLILLFLIPHPASLPNYPSWELQTPALDGKTATSRRPRAA